MAYDGIRKGCLARKYVSGGLLFGAYLTGAEGNNPQFKTARFLYRARSPTHLINSWPSMKSASGCSVFWHGLSICSMGAVQKAYSQAVPQIISHNLKLNNPQLKTKSQQD
jgi:hypothetical protein